eukprot:7382705-Prymnesium_polylepis.2
MTFGVAALVWGRHADGSILCKHPGWLVRLSVTRSAGFASVFDITWTTFSTESCDVTAASAAAGVASMFVKSSGCVIEILSVCASDGTPLHAQAGEHEGRDFPGRHAWRAAWATACGVAYESAQRTTQACCRSAAAVTAAAVAAVTAALAVWSGGSAV